MSRTALRKRMGPEVSAGRERVARRGCGGGLPSQSRYFAMFGV